MILFDNIDNLSYRLEKMQDNDSSNIAESVPNEERKYYREDSYYTLIVNQGTAFEYHVTRFEDRKKTAIPSERGLYPAEILLLDYCKKGDFPHPRNGYQGFWWFKYGIRDVSAALKNLEDKGFIKLGSIKDSIQSLTTPILKKLLLKQGVSTKGNKSELISRTKRSVPDKDLIALGIEPKYILTDIGEKELLDNAYVPYMHRIKTQTRDYAGVNIEVKKVGETTINREGYDTIIIPHIESSIESGAIGNASMGFNIWTINRILGKGNKSDWKIIVDTQEKILLRDIEIGHNAFLADLEENDSQAYSKFQTQDKQLELVQNAYNKYIDSKNLNEYITFWENLWRNGGLLFEGAKWNYELAKAYIKAKRYKDARNFIIYIMNTKGSYYKYQGEKLLQRIDKLADH